MQKMVYTGMHGMMEPQKRIMSLQQTIDWHTSLKAQNKTLVVTNGCFDLMHRGHAEYLYNASQLGDALLILLNSDSSVRSLKGQNRPIVAEENRAYMLASLFCVDAVLLFNGKRCTKELELIQPKAYAKANDYTLDTLDPEERNALQMAGTKVHFIPFVKDLSTSNIIEKIKSL